MLLECYDKDDLIASFLPWADWRPFPPATDRAAWRGLLDAPLNRQRKDYLVSQADDLLGQAWPDLPATLYMEFTRNGNRVHYERPYFERRSRLGILVLAECMTYQGKYLDEIVNGIWHMLSEPTWCIPTHAYYDDHDPLPSNQLALVDLFACETAMVFAEAWYLLRGPLEALSPSLCERLRQAILERVVQPVQERTDIWWMAGRNNWTPWCLSNTVGAAMYVLEDPEPLADLCIKAMGIVDLFIGQYGPDGGCDEGPGYWGVAAGALLMFLELLHERSQGKIDVYDEPLIANMGRYIFDVHLSGPWFANFADGAARVGVRRAVTYQYGRRTGQKSMQDLALLSARQWEGNGAVEPLFNGRITGEALTYMLRELWWVPCDDRPGDLKHAKNVWLGDLQVMVARESEIDTQGMILAAKGGHNGEQHNHNDIGQFMLFLDGQPGVVDIGVETYRRKTFSRERFDIWCIRSSGHNVPLVNGFEQSAGKEFAATDVTYSPTDAGVNLSMELKDAYPKDAQIVSLRREFIFHRTGETTITIKDAFSMEAGAASLTAPLYCAAPVKSLEPGKLAIQTKPRTLVLEYPTESMKAEVTMVALEDAKLRQVWGDSLNLIRLEYIAAEQTGSYQLTFRVAPHSV